MTYASIAVIDLIDDTHTMIEAISIENECAVLAGAWKLLNSETADIVNILRNKILLTLDQRAIGMLTQLGLSNFGDVNEFVDDAKTSARETQESFENWVHEDPKKRRSRNTPTLHQWPSNFELSDSASVLISMGKISSGGDYDFDFKKVLQASRLLVLLINSWREDEQERVSRKYLNSEYPESRLLPPTWMNILELDVG